MSSALNVMENSVGLPADGVNANSCVAGLKLAPYSAGSGLAEKVVLLMLEPVAVTVNLSSWPNLATLFPIGSRSGAGETLPTVSRTVILSKYIFGE